jgi:hypothetical protein
MGSRARRCCAKAGPVERASFSHRTIFAGLVLSLFGAVLVAGYIYERYVRYVPTAAYHIPQGATFAARVDVEQAVVYDPFRRFLLPIVERARQNKEPRAKHLERLTTLELAVDARELVYAEVPDGGWIVAGGGLFRREGLLDGVRRMMEGEGIPLGQGEVMLIHESGICFAVSDGGNLLLASSPDLLTSVLNASFGAAFGDAAEGALLFVQAKGIQEGPRALTAWVQPAEPFELRVVADPAFGAPAEFVEKVEQSQDLSLFRHLTGHEFHQGDHPSAAVATELSGPQFDEVVQRLAARIEQSLSKSLNSAP